MTSRPSRKLTAILILLTAVPLLSLNMFLPSLGVMANEFRIGFDKMAWAVSGYLGFTAVLQVLAGPAADRFGRRPILLVSLALFCLASVGCALAQDAATFLILRVLQGAIITGAVLSYAIAADIAGPRQTASILGYIAAAISLVPILGPSIGGILAEFAGWRANFWLYAALGLMLLLLVRFRLPETGTLGATGGGNFLPSYLALLRSLHFWAYSLIMALGIGAFYVFISGIPLVAERAFNMSELQIGVAIGSITLGYLLGSVLSGRYSELFSADRMILAGRCVASLGLLTSAAFLAAGYVTLPTLLAGTACVGVGNGLTTPNASSAVMNVRKELSASASGLFGAVVVLFGAALTSLSGWVLTARPTPLALATLMLACTLVSLAIAVWTARRRLSAPNKP